MLEGCATGPPRGSLLDGAGRRFRPDAAGSAGGFPEQTKEEARPPGGSAPSSNQEELARFLACTSPAEFIELQHGVDMPRLVEELEDWPAVRLGALGPLVEDAAASILNRKRASFLVTTTEKYGVARAEVFALFILHSAFDDELRQVLVLLARDKRLGETLGQMGAVREELERRGLNLSSPPDREERFSDVARGLSRAAQDILSSSPVSNGAGYLELSAQRGQLPPPYQQALDEVERAELEQHLSPGNVALGSFDALTFGVPLGFYSLATGTGHGMHSLAQGHYEQATRELTPAALLVALYAGGKGVRYVSAARGATGTASGGPRLQMPAPRSTLAEVLTQLEKRLGGDAMGKLARYIQANREAGRLVAVGGPDAAAALHEARGDVAKAQVWLSQAKPQRAGPAPTRAGAGKSLGGLASLVDETAGLTPEVVEARLVQAELDSAGPRLSGSVAALEKQRPALATPPLEAQGHPLWGEYVAYWENRLAELKQGKAVKPPLAWEGYGEMRGLFARGLAFERLMVSLLRADASLPRAMRRFLEDFNQPRIETNVGVSKPGTPGVRFADVLVIEQQPLPGQPPRMETFSFKSRDLSLLEKQALTAQMKADASEALRYYGETLELRRPSLKHLGPEVLVHRVRLIYEGGKLKPTQMNMLKVAVEDARKKVKGVEVLFQ